MSLQMLSYKSKAGKMLYWGTAIGALLGSLAAGAYVISPSEWPSALLQGPFYMEGTSYLVWHIRMPRLALGFTVGAGLSVAGAAIQGLFRNPLADPGLIGISSGAMVFAVIGIVAFSSLPFLGSAQAFLIPLLAFGGSLLSTGLVYRLATYNGQTRIGAMLLAGVALTALGGAIVGLFSYLATEDELRDITFWTLGSLGGVGWKQVLATLPFVLASTAWLLRQHQALDLLLLGEREALYAGLEVQPVKWGIITAAALGVGAGVAACGAISFVALVVPHAVRTLQGPSHRGLLPAAALLGGTLLVVADAAARICIAPAELPIGIITALLGAPFFLWLLLRQMRSGALPMG